MAHVAVLASYAPSLVNFRGPLLRALVADGHRVTALAPGPASDVAATLAGWGIAYEPVSLERTGMNVLADLRDAARLVGVWRRLAPDLVLAYTIKPVVYGLVAARLAGVKGRYALVTGLGYTFQGDTPARRALSALTGSLYRVALAGARRAIFQNPDDRDLFVARRLVDPGKTLVVNGSGVDLDHYTPLPLPAEPCFLLVARLLVEKGVREYVAAARQVCARHPEARFLLAGPLDPNPAAIPQAELDAWVAEGVVEYLGEISDVRPVFERSSVYVLPSYREGTPRTVLEAMAHGRPIITTDAPGCRQTVDAGVNGVLVAVRDPDALAAAMERLLDPATRARMGAASLALVRQRYDVRRINADMIVAMGLHPMATS